MSRYDEMMKGLKEAIAFEKGELKRGIDSEKDGVYTVETLAAMRESEDIVAHPNRYKSYDSAEELFDAIVTKQS